MKLLKRLTLLGVVGVMLLGGCITAPVEAKAADNPADVTVYRFDDLGFQAEVPSDWITAAKGTENCDAYMKAFKCTESQLRSAFDANGLYFDTYNKSPETDFSEIYIQRFDASMWPSEYKSVENLSEAEVEGAAKEVLAHVASKYAGADMKLLKCERRTAVGITFLGLQYIESYKEPTYLANMYIALTDDGVFLICGRYALLGSDAYSVEKADLIYGYLDNFMNSLSEISGDTVAVTQTTVAEDDNSFLKKLGAFEFPMFIFLVVTALFLIIGVKFSGFKKYHEEPLSLEVSKGIQGICAVLIIIHHLTQAIGAENAFMFDKGVMMVGIFFFFSGYGLFKSMMTKEDYFKGFFRKRFTAILIPFYACIILFMLTAWATGTTFKTTEVIGYLSGWSLINPHMWYIVEIAALYTGFYFIFRFIKKENIAMTVMGVFTVGIITGSLILCHGNSWFQGEWWYNSTFLFFIGMLVAKLGKKVRAFAEKLWWILVPVCAAATVGLYYAADYVLKNYSYYAEPVYGEIGGLKEKFICLSCQIPMTMFFVFTLILLTMKLRFGNQVMKHLGKISLELYLIHNLLLIYLRSDVIYIESNSIYVLLTIVLSVVLAGFINGFDRWLISAINIRKQKLLSEEKLDSVKIHSVDCMRLIAIFLVVCIHVPFAAKNMGEVFIAFGKTAVPFLLVASGYFLYMDESNKFMARLMKQTKKLLILTVGAHVLYLVFELLRMASYGTVDKFVDMYINGQNLKNLILWNMSPFSSHLWFLGSMLYALVMLMMLNKLNIHKIAMFLSPVLLGVYIFLSWNKGIQYYVSRNAILVTLPYMMMGCLIKRYYQKLKQIPGFVLILLFAVLCVTNIIELGSYNNMGVPFFSAEIMTYVIFLILLKYPNLGAGTLTEKLGKRCTLFIYIVHMIPIMLISRNSPLMEYLGPVVIFTITLLLAVLFKIKYFLPTKKIKEESVQKLTEEPVESVNK